MTAIHELNDIGMEQAQPELETPVAPEMPAEDALQPRGEPIGAFIHLDEQLDLSEFNVRYEAVAGIDLKLSMYGALVWHALKEIKVLRDRVGRLENGMVTPTC